MLVQKPLSHGIKIVRAECWWEGWSGGWTYTKMIPALTAARGASPKRAAPLRSR